MLRERPVNDVSMVSAAVILDSSFDSEDDPR